MKNTLSAIKKSTRSVLGLQVRTQILVGACSCEPKGSGWECSNGGENTTLVDNINGVLQWKMDNCWDLFPVLYGHPRISTIDILGPEAGHFEIFGK